MTRYVVARSVKHARQLIETALSFASFDAAIRKRRRISRMLPSFKKHRIWEVTVTARRVPEPQERTK